MKQILNQLMAEISTIQSRCSPEMLSHNIALKEKILIAYQLKVTNEVKALLEGNTETLQESLQNYLSQNWMLIKGTYLSYTSLTKAPITKLLCTISHALTEELNRSLDTDEAPYTAIELLMPGLNGISVSNNYPDLKATRYKEFSEDEKNEYALLQQKMIEGLLPTTDEDIVFDGAISDYDTEAGKKEAYERLVYKHTRGMMSQKQFESQISALHIDASLKKKLEQSTQLKRYEQLKMNCNMEETIQKWLSSGLVQRIGQYIVPNISIEELISTHISSSCHQALIPVVVNSMEQAPYRDFALDKLDARRSELLAEMNKALNQPQNEESDLAFTQKKQEYEQVCQRLKVYEDEVINRLIHHSPWTKSLAEARKNITRLKEDKGSLLGHLTELCKQLKLNDAHEGIGRQAEAGAGAFEAIRVFWEYHYKMLGYQLIPLDDTEEERIGDLDVAVRVSLDEDNIGFHLHYKVIDEAGVEQQGSLNEHEFPELMNKIKKLEEHNTPLTEWVLYQELFSVQNNLLSLLKHKGLIDPSREEKQKIPCELRNEIELLLELSRNNEFNKNATENMETCIGTRREKLERLVEHYKNELITIGCSEHSLASYLKKAEQEVAQRERLFHEALQTKQYIGEDKLPISGQLIKVLDVPLDLKSLATLNALMQLEVEEIKAILSNKEQAAQVVELFISIEDFYYFTLEQPSKKIQALLDATCPVLIRKLCPTPNKCNYLLFAQTDERFAVLAKELLCHCFGFNVNLFLAQQPGRASSITYLLNDRTTALLALANNFEVLDHLPEAAKDIPSLMNAQQRLKLSVLYHPEAKFKSCSGYLNGNDEEIKQGIELDRALFGLSGEKQNNIAAVLSALAKSPMALQHAAKKFHTNQDLIDILMIENNEIRAQICACYLKVSNKGQIIEDIAKNSSLFPYLPESLRDNTQIVVAALKQNRFLLQAASKRLQEDPCLKRIVEIEYDDALRKKALSCYLEANNHAYVIEKVERDIWLLHYLPEPLRDNPRIVIAALRKERGSIISASKRLQQDGWLARANAIYHDSARELAFSCYLTKNYVGLNTAIQQDVAFFGLSGEAKNNKTAVIAALAASVSALQYASEALQNDEYVKLIASIQLDNELRTSACDCYLKSDDINFVTSNVLQRVKLFRYLPLELRAQPRVVMAALIHSQSELAQASIDIQQNPLFQRVAAIRDYDLRLKVCSCYIQHQDIKSVVVNVLADIRVFDYLSESLRDEPRVVVAALIHNKYALHDASKRLQKNVSLHRLAEIDSDEQRILACYCYLRSDDAEYVMRVVAEDSWVFEYLPETVRDNERVVLTASIKNKDALLDASLRLQDDEELNRIAHIDSDTLRGQVCYCYLNLDDIDYVIEEIKTNPQVLDYLPSAVIRTLLNSNIEGETWLHYCLSHVTPELFATVLNHYNDSELETQMDRLNTNEHSVLQVSLYYEEHFRALLNRLPKGVLLNPSFPNLVQQEGSLQNKQELLQKPYLDLLFDVLNKELERNAQRAFRFTQTPELKYRQLKEEINACIIEAKELSKESMQLLQQGSLGTVIEAWSSCLGYESKEEFLHAFKDVAGSHGEVNRMFTP